jgi:uncharacterized protein YbjT (DUF2867 family)
MPISGSGRAAFQPIWAEDVADCVIASLPGGPHADAAVGARYELAGPQTLSYEQLVACALRSFGRRRRILRVPAPLVRASLNTLELLTGAAFATWDEAELLEVPLIARRGTADAESLGVTPKPIGAVLGTGGGLWTSA